jgi:hypothetical protein
MPAELDIVEMLRVSDPKHADELVLAAIEGALASVGLYPDNDIDGRSVDRLRGNGELWIVPPVHEHEMERALPRS